MVVWKKDENSKEISLGKIEIGKYPINITWTQTWPCQYWNMGVMWYVLIGLNRNKSGSRSSRQPRTSQTQTWFTHFPISSQKTCWWQFTHTNRCHANTTTHHQLFLQQTSHAIVLWSYFVQITTILCFESEKFVLWVLWSRNQFRSQTSQSRIWDYYHSRFDCCFFVCCVFIVSLKLCVWNDMLQRADYEKYNTLTCKMCTY